MATLINGNGNLAIYAQQDADWYASIMGGQTVITGVGQQFEYSLLDANTIGVSDGVIITKEGRRIQLDVNEIDTFDIPSGAQGTTNYYIIGYHLVTGDQSEQTVETFVQLMENGTDTIPEGSFREGDDDVFVSLYRVQQNDLALGTITLLLPKVDSLQQQLDEINADLTTSLIATQNGSGTKSVTLDVSTKNRIIAVSKNGSTLLHCVEIPTAILTNGLVIPLGKLGTSAPVVGASTPLQSGKPQDTSMVNSSLGVMTGTSRTFIYNANGTNASLDKSFGLKVNLSSAINISSANITYDGNNSFTITSVSGIEVSLYA